MTRAHGIDISKWQGFYNPTDFPPRPVDFVIQRLSYGRVIDEKLAELAVGVMKAPVKGAYHYYSSAVGWKEQCDLFLSLLEPYDFFGWDVEKAYNYPSTAWLQGIARSMAYLAKESGKPGVIYTGPSVWAEWLYPVQAELRGYGLWTANYWWHRAATNPRILPTMRPDWKFWQYDDKGGGNKGKLYGAGSYGLDLNVFNGTVEELRRFASASPSPVPVPVPAPPVAQNGYLVDRELINVRSSPTGAIIGTLKQNTYITIDKYWNPRAHFTPMAGWPEGGWVWFEYLKKAA